MSETIKKFQIRLTEWFMGMDRKKQILFSVGVLLVVIILSFIITSLTRTKYITLSRGLNATKAGEITNKLEELGISWRAEDNSTTLLVPENHIDRARMQLSLSGVTTDRGFTFENVMDRLSFTQTTEEKNKMFLYQTQSEIANALRTLDAIDDASVILNVKASSSFLNIEEDLSSASIQLRVTSGKNLSQESVNGIVSFVTTAIKGLTPENVTVIDQTGAKLNVFNDDGILNLTGNRDDLKVAVENRLDKNIGDFLAQIYGSQNVKIKTSVVLDFDAETTNIIQFSPPIEGTTDGLVRSLNAIKENVVGGSAGGVAGTDTNTTETPNYPTLEEAKANYSKTQETLNYELNEIQKTITKAEGQISGVSIGVIINKDALESETLTESHKEEVVKLVTAAAGVKDTKVVEVVATSFHIEPVVPIEPPAITVFGVPIWVIGLLLGIIAVLGIVILIVTRRKAASLKVAQEIIEEQEELEEINTEFQDRSSPKYQIEKFIESKPEAVAQLLRSWLNEE